MQSPKETEQEVPEVSVCLITYNQVNYIKEAVESVLSQKAKFKFEVVIGDDFSNDGTREVLIEYEKKYPKLIKLNLLSEKGSGAPGKENFLSTLELCRGKYIAVLDGDDYWTDKNKLDIQKRFLDNNPGYVMCHHDCEISDKRASETKEEFNSNINIAGFYDACQITFPFFLSVMFRRDGLKGIDLRERLTGSYVGDWGLWCSLTLAGNAFFIDRKMGYYRVLKSGLSHNIPYPEYISGRINFLNQLLNESITLDRKFISKMMSKLYLLSCGVNLENRDVKCFRKEFSQSISFFMKGLLPNKSYTWIKRFKYSTIMKTFIFNVFNFIRGRNNYAT